MNLHPVPGEDLSYEILDPTADFVLRIEARRTGRR